jgi:PAS domain S-box-containing protein
VHENGSNDIPPEASLLVETVQQKTTSDAVSRRLLNSIVVHSEDAILAKDLDGVILFWNKGAEKIYGYTPEEVIGKSVEIIMPHDHEGEFKSIMEQLRSGNRIEHYETIRVTKHGKRIPVSVTISPIIDHDGEIIGASAIGRDISRQRALQSERNMLASIVDSSHDAIFSKTLDGIITSWNRGAEKIYGYTAEEAVGKHVSILVPPEAKIEISQILERLKRGERIEPYETVRVRKDGTRIIVSLTISPIIDDQGNVVAASAIGRDITEQKRINDLIRSQLKEKEILLKEVHHRVKNNLQVISSLLELRSRNIKNEASPDAAFRESIDRIRAISLVHEKLYRSQDLSKINFTVYVRNLLDDL